MTIDEQIFVMTAFKNGAEIESTGFADKSVWKVCSDPSWNWMDYNYRIKEAPKPKVKRWLWLIRGHGGSIGSTFFKTTSYFTSENEVRTQYREAYYDILGKVPNSELEFDE